MGTNFYLHTNYCPCCGQPREKIHIGKASYGWKFLIHKIPNRIFDYGSFCSCIKTGVIYDEYGQKWEEYEFLKMIQSFQKERSHSGCECIDDYDFAEGDFC